MEYIKELERIIQGYTSQEKNKELKIVLKIESQKGVDFVRNTSKKVLQKYLLMAARDDFMIHIGGLKMLEAVKLIVEKDSEAICASRLFFGLE